jgi:cell division GTPase FtsZ
MSTDEFDFALPAVEPSPFKTKEEDRYNESVDVADFGLAEDFGIMETNIDEDLLPENEAVTAINCAVVGVGGGGNKMAKAFLDLGFNRTLLVNTTGKDIPAGTDEEHVVLIPNSDGIGKDVAHGKSILESNSAVVEDALRTRIGRTDWLFVFAGGGGGTGSSVVALNKMFDRYLTSVQASGRVIYVVSWPTAQENLNPTIARNALSLLNDVADYPHIVIDNERQSKLLRGRVGMLGLFPSANAAFGKLISQVLKLSTEISPIQSFDSKDLETCLDNSGRMFIGSTIIQQPNTAKLGSMIMHNCLNRSVCPPPVAGKPKTGTLLLIASEEMVADPKISKHLEAAIAYVGGRTDTLFSGVYVRKNVPGLIAILCMNGIERGK